MFGGAEATGNSIIYSLPYKARCIAPQLAHEDNSRFFAGTTTLKEENEIHLIEVENDEEVKRIGYYPHSEGEIYGIFPSPHDESLLFTTHAVLTMTDNNMATATGYKYQASLFKIDDDDKITKKLSLIDVTGTTKAVLWDMSGSAEDAAVVSLDDHNIRYWKLSENSSSAQSDVVINTGDKSKITTGCWDPHFAKQLATVSDTSIRGWDLRSSQQTFLIENAHGQQVRDIDFNRNRPYYFATCGDDCKVRFWDYRKVDAPVKEFSLHTHWVWNVKYNPSHDQLVISSSTDRYVNLYNVVSISFSSISGSITSEDPAEAERKPIKEDHLIRKYEEHEDSVYSIAWSAHDAWTFASLSYDGRIAINYVPDEERMRILFATV